MCKRTTLNDVQEICKELKCTIQQKKKIYDLKQKEAWSVCADSTNKYKGIN